MPIILIEALVPFRNISPFFRLNYFTIALIKNNNKKYCIIYVKYIVYSIWNFIPSWDVMKNCDSYYKTHFVATSRQQMTPINSNSAVNDMETCLFKIKINKFSPICRSEKSVSQCLKINQLHQYWERNVLNTAHLNPVILTAMINRLLYVPGVTLKFL